MALTVAYTAMGRGRKEESGYRYRTFKLVFGNGTLTYGTGIAIDKKMLGCPSLLANFIVVGENDGYAMQFDRINSILHVYQVPASSALTSAAPLIELASGATPAAITIYVEAVGW